MAVPQGLTLWEKPEKNPAADNRSENTSEGIQQELPHRRILLCGRLAHAKNDIDIGLDFKKNHMH